MALGLYGLKPEFDVQVDTTSIYTIGGSSALFVQDLDGNRRTATLQDLEDLTRLQDALPNLHIMHGIVNPQDIPQPGFDRRLFPAVMKNTARNYYSQGIGGQNGILATPARRLCNRKCGRDVLTWVNRVLCVVDVHEVEIPDHHTIC